MDKYYTAEKASELLNLHIKTIRRFIREGRINAKKVGREWRITGHELSKFTENQKDLLSFSESPNINQDISIKEGSFHVSTTIRYNIKDFEKAGRYSNSIVAMLNGIKGEYPGTRYQFSWLDDEKIACYSFIGSPELMIKIISMFKDLEGEKNEV